MSEANEAKRDGAKLQKNSGRNYEKGDAIWGDFVVDYKETAKSFSLNKAVWMKICSDTFRVSMAKKPLVKIIMGEGNSKVRLAVIEWDVLDELVDKAWKYDDLGN